jgi:hypothetical protein
LISCTAASRKQFNEVIISANCGGHQPWLRGHPPSSR